MYGVFCFATFANSYTYKLIVPEAHFHAETIGASPAVIARKTAKLFKLLYSPTQRGPTIVALHWEKLATHRAQQRNKASLISGDVAQQATTPTLR